MEQPDLFKKPCAHARRTDPETSHAAARSISSDKLRQSQDEVLRLFDVGGNMTDVEVALLASVEGVVQSPSGLRTRRRELVDLGLLKDTGKRERLLSGRQAIVWGKVE
jgi:hypothetical protein